MISTKFWQLQRKHYGLYSLLSKDPPIFYVTHWMNDLQSPSMELIYEFLDDRTAYFICVWYYNIVQPEAIKQAKQFERDHRQSFPGHQFIHLCNTLEQLHLFQEHGLECIFCNHNCAIDEMIFRPISSRADLVVYDTVYDAKIASYKRHYLAAQIESLALIYYFSPLYDDSDYLEMIKQQFNYAHFFNHQADDYKMLSPPEVNQCLNQCKIGLCLSAEEGAMYASVQYLLAGLPVVSTRSRGGREVFFDDPYVLIVDDHPQAVKEGVAELMGRQIPASEIRRQTLEKLRPHRERLIALVQYLYDREGIERDFASEWPTVFFNKLVKPIYHAETIRHLRAGSVDPHS